MKKRILYFLAVVFSFTIIKAQTSHNLSGTFEGIHYEFDAAGPVDTAEYFYKFVLEQESNKVTGKSYIYNDDGYYAVVTVRGFVVENKFFFEEYNTVDETNPSEQSWCYNSGHLDIETRNGALHLSGFTKSYTKSYGNFCRVGSSELMRTSATEVESIVGEEIQEIIDDYHPIVSPNPTEGETTIKFQMYKPAQVIIEVYDLAGELKIEVLRQWLLSGTHIYEFDLSFESDGMYVVELLIGDQLYSTELWKGLQ